MSMKDGTGTEASWAWKTCLPLCMGVVLLILVLAANEAFDLPHRLFGPVPHGTAFNWAKALTETVLVVAVSCLVFLAMIPALRERKRVMKRARHRHAVVLAIRNIHQLILGDRDLPCLLQSYCDCLTQTRGYHTAWIVVLDESGRLAASAQAGLGEDSETWAQWFQGGNLTDCARAALAAPGVVAAENPLSSCRHCPLIATHAGRAGFCTRLEESGRVHGVLGASAPVEFTLDEDEQTLFQEVARDIALALHDIEATADHDKQEQHLRESEQRYRDLFSHMTSGVAVYEPTEDGTDFIIRDMNRAAQEIDCVSREEIVGKRLTEVFPGVMEFGLFDVLQRVSGTGKSEHHPAACYHDQRLKHWCENWVYRLLPRPIVPQLMTNNLSMRHTLAGALGTLVT